MLVGHLYIFLGEMSVQVFCPFFSWVVVFFAVELFISCLYILEIKPSSVASFENIFSHSGSYIFVFFLVSFDMQKVVSLGLGPIG